MRTWAIMLSGLLIWAAHFFILYGIGEFIGDGFASRLAIAALTGVYLTICALLAAAAMRMPPRDFFGKWRIQVALAGLGIGALAILWQSLPALLAH